MATTSTRVEPKTDSELVTAALRFARRVHLGQYRKQTYEQFVEHPIAVARLLSEQGLDGPVMAAAYLHDVVEKTPVTLEELGERFGPEVASIVGALSEDSEVEGYAARKRGLRRRVLESEHTVVLIYAADRAANVRDWTMVAPDGREDCAARLGTDLGERLQLWDEDLEELAGYDPELPFLADFEDALRALKAEAPA